MMQDFLKVKTFFNLEDFKPAWKLKFMEPFYLSFNNDV